MPCGLLLLPGVLHDVLSTAYIGTINTSFNSVQLARHMVVCGLP
jgi:hypothetical protein